MAFKKLLVPIDDSEYSKHSFQHALELAQAQGARVALLHCYGHIPMLIGGEARESLVKDFLRESKKLLKPYVQRLRKAGVEPALIIKEGHPGDVIVQEAQAGDFDLIVMGSRGRSDLLGVLLGGVAHRVLSLSHCPVLLTR